METEITSLLPCQLVFEIEEGLAGEAVGVIEKIMVHDATVALRWPVPLKVDVEFGEDWTVPFNLTEMMWNKGGGKWDERWVRAFPSQYEHYLSCGGSPLLGNPGGHTEAVRELFVEGVSEEKLPEATVRPKSAPHPTSPRTPAEMSGDSYVFRVNNTLMTPQNAERLARVIVRCIDRGVDLLQIKDDKGNDLLGSPIRVAYEEFRVIADYEGL